jgi:hormone-sensitive lipase
MRSSSTTPSGLNHISKSSTALTLETVDLTFNFDMTYTQLRDLAETNRTYFSQQKTDVCRRFERLLILLSHSLELSIPLIRYLTENFHHFDYNSEIRANGYRTLVVAHGQACLRTLDILKLVDTRRVGLLFNLMYSSRLFQDLENWTKALTGMQHLLSFAVKMVDYSQKKVLCIDADQVPLDVELDYFKIVAFDSEYFFGRTCGFQFTQSMQTMLTFILAGLATYYETYNRSIPFAAASLATAPKYLLFPEQRAKKCASIFRDSDYLFCKSFWNLVDHDYIKMGSRYIAPNVTVSKYFQIGPEPIEIDSVIVAPPSAGAGAEEPIEQAAGNVGAGSDNPTGSGSKQPKQLVNIKLLSSQIREGMNELPLKKTDLETSSSKISPMSDQLLMHVHGGGFIATSSTTHEVYLKPWALGLEIPIVSVDYSLAPEYPFPRAIEECYYAYAWILKNANKLGWTGKTILLVGDSAGGNLITIVTMKAIEAGLRKPDAIICFYTPFLLGYSMSPSRLMAIMDPLLNTGFLWRCLAAYAGIKSDNEPPNDEISSATITTTDTAPEQDGQIKLERKQSFQDSDHMRQDTYYTRLTDIIGSRQAYLLRKLRESPLPNHPHMSPLRASDDILRQFPTTYLIVSFLFFVDYLFSSVACWSRQLHFESTKNTFHHFRHVILTHYWMIR